MFYITKFWLNKHNVSNTITELTLHHLYVILKQSRFQYNKHFFQPEKEFVMGSRISNIIAEIYLQFLEVIYIKQWKKASCYILRKIRKWYFNHF